MSELLEKANPGIVIALCGNKADLEERQVSQEVKNFLIKRKLKNMQVTQELSILKFQQK